MNKKYAWLDFPAWFDGKDINEAAFCREFLSKNKLIYADNAFFTPDGRLTDPLLLNEKIYAELECCAAKKHSARHFQDRGDHEAGGSCRELPAEAG